MAKTMTIRETTDADLDDVLSVERDAFGGEDEARLARDVLNDASAAPCLSLLAFDGDRAVGHILFSKAHLTRPQEAPPQGALPQGAPAQGDARDAASAAILAPLAVVPDLQKRGIGGALIARGLRMLAEAGVDLVFVLGHPDYYPRHGFVPAGRLGFEAPYPIADENADAWMVQALRPGLIGAVSGRVVCCDTMDKPEVWRE